MSANEPSSKLLAFDTSTEVMFIAVTDGKQIWQHTAEGGAKTSAALIPAIMALLKEANLTLQQLDAIVFGRGPGSFTGLRTACSVAQGLAFGAGGVQVLPINTLLAVAEEARFNSNITQIQAVLDARMGEVYAASYAYKDGIWSAISDIQLCKPDQLQLETGFQLAGNCLEDDSRINALPTATAMLRLAPAMLAAGLGVPADQALPLYVRDKVAQTTAERADLKNQVISQALKSAA
ncbi:MAG: tRNA (adenosine(37)-N6)-threonylcarbamoyltransferase complex dimerization subunit type 1 TsaB [Burkholderiaceae bacterium]